ncbi:MAG TPA: PAS domain-containing sensor histidine kinase [Chitinophagaceae bacterium]
MLDQAHMTSLFENATEGIILTNSNGEIVLINPAAERIFGYKPEELYGKTIEVLIPDRFKLRHHAHRENFYHHPGNRVMGAGRDLFARKKNDTDIPVEISLSHYKKGDELFIIAFIVDITQRKEIEADMLKQKGELEKITGKMRQLNADLEVKVEERTLILKEALQRLEQSQEELSESLDKERQLNEIKSRFVSMASHEFRTPLSTVLSSASLLSKYTAAEDQSKRDKHINRIKDSVKHLNDILEDFLSLGKLDEGRVLANSSFFNLDEELTEILAEMKFSLKKGQQFNYHFEGSKIIFADKKLLKNIGINLLSNAIKFSGENAGIDIAAAVTDKQTDITITDHGIGISAEDQEHLFSSFFRGANAIHIQGTGLGLHIVKRYVDLLEGVIELQSELGKGTTIKISFPCLQTE